MNRARAVTVVVLVLLWCATDCQRQDRRPRMEADDNLPAATSVQADEVVPAAAPTTTTGPSVPAPSPLTPGPGTFADAPFLAGAKFVAVARTADGPRLVIADGAGLESMRPDGSDAALFAQAGAPQVLEAIDIDSDGVDEIVVGRGRGRGAIDAKLAVTVHSASRLSESSSIPLPATTRAQVVSVSPGIEEGELIIVSFVSKYVAAVSRAQRTGAVWDVREIGRSGVLGGATEVRSKSGGVIVVAHTYGERVAGSDGMVTAWRAAAPDQRQIVPSTRGARAIARVPGTNSVVFTDGRHKNYGQKAQALITRATYRDAGFEVTTLAQVKARHGYHRLTFGDVDGDGAAELIGSGHGPAILMSLSDGQAVPATVWALGRGEAHHVAAGDLDGDGADEVVIVGPVPGIYRARRAAGAPAP